MNSESKNVGMVGAFLGGCFTLVFICIMLGFFIAFGQWLFSLI